MTRPLPLSEADWQRRVLDTARATGWLACHYRPALSRHGRWATPLEGDRGAPDLILAKGGRLLLAELKAEKGKPTIEQRAWLEALGAHGRLWRPSDWDQVLADLGVSR